MTTTENPPEDTETGRSRARRNVIGRSPHKDEYERLMKAGWASLAIERYAAYRYGEDIPASTVRTYRGRKKMQVEKPVNPLSGVEVPEVVADVLGIRAQLIELQRARIAIDWTHEKSMSKLFGSTKGEIAALSALLDAHKADLQDLGLMGKAGDVLTVKDDRPKATAENGAPVAQTLADLLGADPGTEMELARVLHLGTKPKANDKSSGEQAG